MSQILKAESAKYIYFIAHIKGSGSHLQSQNVRLNKNNGM